METFKNILEYYDELFPVTESQKNFYKEIISKMSFPVKFLRVNCGTGLFESQLSKEGHDVTGVESVQELLNTANLRRRTQLMSIRFFYMQLNEISKFLGKGFYDVISILDSRIMFVPSQKEMQQLFCDLKSLLKNNGKLILHLINFEKYIAAENHILPERKSLRVSLKNRISLNSANAPVISSRIETGSGRILPVLKDEPIFELTPNDIEKFAEEAGFSSAEFYADYDKNEFTGNEDYFVVVLQ